MFDPKKPTVLLLGRWQPWHDGHLALFERALAKTGQVVIQVRYVEGSSGGKGQDDNPFSYEEITKDISLATAAVPHCSTFLGSSCSATAC